MEKICKNCKNYIPLFLVSGVCDVTIIGAMMKMPVNSCDSCDDKFKEKKEQNER
jgi:hypothetical protein